MFVPADKFGEQKFGEPAATPASFTIGELSMHKLGGRFKADLFRYPGKGGWTFVTIPERLTPPVTHGWGRTPVHAIVDGYAWDTSVWRGKDGRALLAIPKRARGAKEDGASVTVQLKFASL